MEISRECKVAIYLTGRFGKFEGEQFDPLKSSEWHEFCGWLSQNSVAIGDLNEVTVMELPIDWEEINLTPERIRDLLKRRFVSDEKVQRWVSAGLWMLTLSDESYPKELMERLQDKSPPVLYGSGNPELLNLCGVAIVGSRNADASDLEYSTELAKDLAGCDYSIISGGARGVDQAAMLGALENGGKSVGVLADKLLQSTTSSLYRKHLVSGDLVLVSPFHPETSFTAWNAMARNHIIYALAQSAVVITCDENSGGSWRGAIDNLNSDWTIPLWVKRSGNAALHELGAFWLPDNGANSIVGYLDTPELSDHEEVFFDLFLRVTRKLLFDGPRKQKEITDHFLQYELSTTQVRLWLNQAVDSGFVEQGTVAPGKYSFPQTVTNYFELFRFRLEDLLSDGPKKIQNISKHFSETGLSESQVRVWLNQASYEGFVKKKGGKRAEYALVTSNSIFFEFFTSHMQNYLSEGHKSLQETFDHCAQFDLSNQQVRVWLGQAVDQGSIEKKKVSGKVAYGLFDNQKPKQGELPLG